MPGSSSEVLVTSSDSRIRVVDGTDLVNKLKGKVSNFVSHLFIRRSKSINLFLISYDRVSEYEQPDLCLDHSRWQIRGFGERGLTRVHMEVRVPCFSTEQEQ